MRDLVYSLQQKGFLKLPYGVLEEDEEEEFDAIDDKDVVSPVVSHWGNTIPRTFTGQGNPNPTPVASGSAASAAAANRTEGVFLVRKKKTEFVLSMTQAPGTSFVHHNLIQNKSGIFEINGIPFKKPIKTIDAAIEYLSQQMDNTRALLKTPVPPKENDIKSINPFIKPTRQLPGADAKKSGNSTSGWLHGDISRDDAEKLLLKCVEIMSVVVDLQVPAAQPAMRGNGGKTAMGGYGGQTGYGNQNAVSSYGSQASYGGQTAMGSDGSQANYGGQPGQTAMGNYGSQASYGGQPGHTAMGNYGSQASYGGQQEQVKWQVPPGFGGKGEERVESTRLGGGASSGFSSVSMCACICVILLINYLGC